MLKISVMSLSYQRLFRTGQMDLLTFVDACRELDVDGVDVNAKSFVDDSDPFIGALKERCVRQGLSIACLSLSNNFGVTATALPGEIAAAKHWIDRAVLLGAPQVRVFAGRPNATEPREVVWERCRQALKILADYGHERGVLVSLQNHNHGAFTQTGDDVLQFLDGAGPNLGHVWDTGQYVGSPGASGANPDGAAQEVLYRSLQQTVHRATHVRCKFYRIETGVERWLDYPRVLGILRATRYNGFCSVVYEGSDDETVAVPRAVAYLRSLLRLSGRRD